MMLLELLLLSLE